MLYLAFVSFVMLSFTFSRYVTTGGSDDHAAIAAFGTDIFIYSGSSGSVASPVSSHFYATSKISEPSTMTDGTCEYLRFRITNRSDCTVRVTEVGLLSPLSEAADKAYTKLFVDENEEYISQHNGIATSALSYMHGIIDDYQLDPDEITDEKKKSVVTHWQQTFSDDEDFFYPKGSSDPIYFSYELISDSEYLNQIVAVSNKLTLERINNISDGAGTVLAPGESRDLILFIWVEHDNVYRYDADAQNTNASDKNPTALIGNGNRSDVTEHF